MEPSAFSGDRFTVTYLLAGDKRQARRAAEDICIEQTVEFPAELVGDSTIREHIFGRIEAFEKHDGQTWRAAISFAAEIAGDEITQLLNVLFGNISLKPGIRAEDLQLPQSMLQKYRGPRFGVAGLRDKLGVQGRPLLASALKPMGLTPDELAAVASQMARGGIDIIKDDHGLADQDFCRFEERVEKCAAAVQLENRKGAHCIYMPNITAPAEQILERARFARDVHAGGLLVAPGLTGFDSMQRVADDDEISLPLMAHPALLGGWLLNPGGGFAHKLLLGSIMRLAGADAVIFPSFGGRFTFTKEECGRIAEGCRESVGLMRQNFPVPAGGLSVRNVPVMSAFYGADVIFLIGGDLHRLGPDLGENCRQFRKLVEEGEA